MMCVALLVIVRKDGKDDREDYWDEKVRVSPLGSVGMLKAKPPGLQEIV